MIGSKALCTYGPEQPFVRTTIERRNPGPLDVLIDIAFAGVCHSDVEHARCLRGGKTIYPIVPGHEIAGIVTAVGSEVRRFRIGDRVGVGNMVDACGVCDNCQAGLEQYCSGGRIMTYNSIDRDGNPTYGGYSQHLVVNEGFVVRIPDGIALQNAAPLLCAGITMYSPLRYWRAGPGTKVAIIGFGGLGHVGVQMVRALGAHATVLDLAAEKRDDALRLGAHDYRLSTDPDTFAALGSAFDLIISTVPINADLDRYLGLLARDGVYVNLAVSAQPLSVSATALLTNRRSIAGTRSGGIAETQEMLDFCAEHGIGAEVEIIHADGVDDAYRRLLAGNVRFRFVIDNSTI